MNPRWQEAARRPERVAGFLRLVCEILTDLPTGGLHVEVDVLSTQDGRATQPVFGHLLGEAYGAYGVGLAAYREPALRVVIAEEMRGVGPADTSPAPTPPM